MSLEGVFDWVEVGTVGQKIEEARASRLDRLAHKPAFVGWQVVHDHDIAGLQPVLTAAVINLVRLAAWLAGNALARTRHSAFVRLMAHPV